MGRETSSDPLPDCPPDNLARPTKGNYFIQWFESINSTFNITAIDLLVAETLEQNPKLGSEHGAHIREAAVSHALHLRKTYRAALKVEYVKKRLEQQRKVALKRDVSGIARR